MSKKEIRMVPSKGAKVLKERIDPLPVPLTDHELLARGQNLVRLRDDERNTEADFAEQKKAHSKVMSGIAADRERLEQAIRDKREPRPVRVHCLANYDASEYQEVRTDTGEILMSRALMVDEMQFKMNFPDEEEPA